MLQDFHRITADTLCRELGMGRSKLFKLCKELYGCGYSDYNYFICVFSQYWGISPARYRHTRQA